MLSLEEENNEEYPTAIQKSEFELAVYMTSDAWESIKQIILIKACHKLSAEETSETVPTENDVSDKIVSEYSELIKDTKGFEECVNK